MFKHREWSRMADPDLYVGIQLAQLQINMLTFSGPQYISLMFSFIILPKGKNIKGVNFYYFHYRNIRIPDINGCLS